MGTPAIGVINATNVTVTVNEAPRRKRAEVFTRLTPELREQFIGYFTRKYPATKKITLKRHYNGYSARVLYKSEECSHRTFRTSAYTYETLVMKVCEWYTRRGVERAKLA